MKRIKHNDLTHYFLRDHKELPRAYLASCEKFFKSLKRQASSSKQQATSFKLPGPRPISNANKGLIHKRQASSNKLDK